MTFNLMVAGQALANIASSMTKRVIMQTENSAKTGLFFVFIMAVMLILPLETQARAYSGLVVEVDSGRILFERNADELRHPASVTKMMTLYLVFEALARGQLHLHSHLRVSQYAATRPPSKLGLRAGETIAVEDAILALVTRSANDAATAIGENLGGSEPAFAIMMTQKARELGMRRTVFQNASGLPDPDQVTTGWDMYRLARALIQNFPEYYRFFSTPRFYYKGRPHDNHNHLMETYDGMDGIKTGFVNASGFNLVASAKRNGRRLIGVVFGGPSAVRRDMHMRDILDDGFAQLEGQPTRVFSAEFERPEPPGYGRRSRLSGARVFEYTGAEYGDEAQAETPGQARYSRSAQAGSERAYVEPATQYSRSVRYGRPYGAKVYEETPEPRTTARSTNASRPAYDDNGTEYRRSDVTGEVLKEFNEPVSPKKSARYSRPSSPYSEESQEIDTEVSEEPQNGRAHNREVNPPLNANDEIALATAPETARRQRQRPAPSSREFVEPVTTETENAPDDGSPVQTARNSDFVEPETVETPVDSLEAVDAEQSPRESNNGEEESIEISRPAPVHHHHKNLRKLTESVPAASRKTHETLYHKATVSREAVKPPPPKISHKVETRPEHPVKATPPVKQKTAPAPVPVTATKSATKVRAVPEKHVQEKARPVTESKSRTPPPVSKPAQHNCPGGKGKPPKCGAH